MYTYHFTCISLFNIIFNLFLFLSALSELLFCICFFKINFSSFTHIKSTSKMTTHASSPYTRTLLLPFLVLFLLFLIFIRSFSFPLADHTHSYMTSTVIRLVFWGHTWWCWWIRFRNHSWCSWWINGIE